MEKKTRKKGSFECIFFSPDPVGLQWPCSRCWRWVPTLCPGDSWVSHHVCTTDYLDREMMVSDVSNGLLPSHKMAETEEFVYCIQIVIVLFMVLGKVPVRKTDQSRQRDGTLTVLVYSVNRRPPHRELLEVLFGWRGDVCECVNVTVTVCVCVCARWIQTFSVIVMIISH